MLGAHFVRLLIRATKCSHRPYLWLDATYLKVRDGGRIVSVAAIIAVAVTTEGRREIVGLGIGPSEAEPGRLS
jgi:transposase-like protein